MERHKNEKQASSPVPKHQSFIEKEQICPLCKSQLDIRVKTYLENFTIAEEAFCPECGVVTRNKDHKMH